MKDFIEYLDKNPFVGHQEECGKGKNYWNADYWTIEVAKAFYYGDYKVPEKFKGNRNCDPNRINKDAYIKRLMRENLNKIKNDSDFLLVCEVGRGLDIKIANSVKKWKKIYCYDHVNYKDYLPFDNVEFFHQGTSIFNTNNIPHNLTMIVNHSLYPPFKNKNILHAIINGELKW